MQKTVAYVFLALSLLFFLFVIGLSGYRIETARRTNGAQADERAQALLASAEALRDSSGGFDSPYFKAKMREDFDGESRLLALAVYSESDGILYLVSRNRAYLKEPREAAPDWRGTPSWFVSSGYETVVSLSFAEPRSNVTMDAVFVTFGREDLFPILRDDLYLFLAFLLVSGLLLVILMGIREDSEASEPGPAEPEPPVSFTPVPIVPAAPPPQEPADKSLTSPVSGLVWGEYFEPRLASEIERAASTDQDLSLARIELDRLPGGNQAAAYRAAAEAVKDSFPFGDLAFEAGPAAFAVILPEADIDRAIRDLEALRTKLTGGGPEGGRRASLSIGVSSRGGRLVDGATLIEETLVAARKAAREGGNVVIGFRADPDKFRQTLSAAR
jgi:GGDEF domain-containing protein